MASSPSSCVALSSGVSRAAELVGEEQSKQGLGWDPLQALRLLGDLRQGSLSF